MRHSIPVVNQTAEPFRGVYSKCVEVRVRPDSIWLKSQTESAECFTGGPLRLEVEAVSVVPLEYRWYKVV